MKEDEEQRCFVVGWVVIGLTIFWINLYAVSLYHLVEPEVEYEIIGAEKSLQAMLRWPKLVHAAHNGIWIASDDPGSLDIVYLRDCWNDRDWLRMYMDPYCMFLWLRAIDHGQTISIDAVLAVITAQERKLGEKSKSNQNGGMRCKFEGYPGSLGIQGYWKPCSSRYLSGNSENFQSEIIAFHIDQILGFYRTPPVIPRYFNETKLRELARQAIQRSDNSDPSAMFKIQTVMDKCGTPYGAEGAMVGWANYPVSVLNLRRGLTQVHLINMFEISSDTVENLRENEFNVTRDSPKYKITWALENVSVNMFAILMGNPQKFSHSVFIMHRPKEIGEQYGPMLYIDNDRSSWDNDLFRRGVVKPNHPLSQLCKFPLEISQRILLFNNSQGFTLGKLVSDAVEPYQATMKEKPLFSEENAKWLNQRVDFLRNIIEKCIHRYGIEQVLLPEPWLKHHSVIDHWTNILANSLP